jgi:hypothetical protein
MLKRTGPEKKRRSKLDAHGLARVATLLGFVWIAAMVAGVSIVHAETDETLLGLGRDLMRYEGARSESPSHALRLNGARIHLASGMSDDPVATVLDEFELRCRAHDGGLAAQVEALYAPRGVEIPRSLIDGTLRESDAARGFVACLDTRASVISPEDAIAALERFVATHDIAELGDIRYAYAESTEHGTHYVTIASEGALDLDVLFPEVGDVPGNDVPGVPRPVGARRVLAAWEEGAPYGLTLYAGAEGEPEAIVDRMRRGLRRDGFTVIENEYGDEGAAASAIDGTAIVAERADRMVVVSVARNSEGALVSVMTIENGNGTGSEVTR